MPAKYFIFANATYETLFEQKLYSQATGEINVVLPGTNQTLNESLNTSSTIEKVESLAGDSEEPAEEVKQVEEETVKLSPLPKIKAVLTYNKVAFILVDIFLVILIFFVFTRIKKSR